MNFAEKYPLMRTMVLVYKNLHDWVIWLGQMWVNIPAPWSINGICFNLPKDLGTSMAFFFGAHKILQEGLDHHETVLASVASLGVGSLVLTQEREGPPNVKAGASDRDPSHFVLFRGRKPKETNTVIKNNHVFLSP